MRCYGNRIVTDPAPTPPGDPFSALGDAHRRQILALLAEAPRSVGSLAREVPISRPAVSRHLRLLREAGLVGEEAQGTRRIYRLHDEGLAAVEGYLRQVWGDAAARLRLLAENTQPAGHTQPAGKTQPTTKSRRAEEGRR
jgi:DNA-binding transcriptional ArsR family regulator